MTKLDLQKELLEKIKLGTKPSDIKKSTKKPIKNPISPSPISIEKDDGYSSAEDATKSHKSPIKNTEESIIKSSPETSPNEQIKALQKQLNLYKDFREADLKIKEKYKETIKDLQAKTQAKDKTIQSLQNTAKNTAKTPPAEIKTFTCSHCQQEWDQEFLKLIDPQGNKTCAECLENMLELTKQETGKEIIIEEQTKEEEKIKPCQFCRQSYPQSQLKPRHILNLPNHDPREIINICQECLVYRAKKADYYCPLTSEGKDTYEGNEFDCYCPTNPNQNERRTL